MDRTTPALPVSDDPARAARLTAALRQAELDYLNESYRPTAHYIRLFHEAAELSAHVETLEREKAALTAERDEAEARAVDAAFRMKQAEQARDAAHAALADAWYAGRKSAQELSPEMSTGPQLQALCKRDVDAALAASAPQKEGPR
jgi:predicted RNase H-like nuclease (RuvC/YqgF family)